MNEYPIAVIMMIGTSCDVNTRHDHGGAETEKVKHIDKGKHEASTNAFILDGFCSKHF